MERISFRLIIDHAPGTSRKPLSGAYRVEKFIDEPTTPAAFEPTMRIDEVERRPASAEYSSYRVHIFGRKPTSDSDLARESNGERKRFPRIYNAGPVTIRD